MTAFTPLLICVPTGCPIISVGCSNDCAHTPADLRTYRLSYASLICIPTGCPMIPVGWSNDCVYSLADLYTYRLFCDSCGIGGMTVPTLC